MVSTFLAAWLVMGFMNQTALSTTPELDARFLIPNIPIIGSESANKTYDYIVVGAGTAGMTIATRLSEDPKVRVAVLEAGIDYALSPLNKALIDTPGSDTLGCGSSQLDAINDAVDWNFSTTPQAGANNRKVRYARGKTIGGSSARNFMIYQRPSEKSLDQWVELTEDPNWSFQNRLGDFQKSVTFTPPKHDLRQEIPAAQYDARAFANSNGPVQVSYPNAPQPFSKYMQLSLNEKGIPTARDFNLGVLDGVQYASTTIDPNNGHRSSSRAFYAAARSRSNLVVYTNAMVKKIVFDNSSTPRAQGVEFQYELIPSPENLMFTASKEVIISAGTFQSPQILMVSGIGPKDQLITNNIPILVDNPNVGQGMQDHIFFGPTYPLHSIETLTRVSAHHLYLFAQFMNFTLRQQGPLTNNVADMIAFERFSDSKLIALNASHLLEYPADWPHIEYLSAPGVVKDFSNLLALNLEAGTRTGKEFATILAALVAPKSRGSIKIASKDTSVPPIIDPGWLTDKVDQQLAIEVFKRTRGFFSANAMQPILSGEEYLPGSSVQTDDEILGWIRNNLMTVWHASCTCSMRTKDRGGVLDSHFRVYGTTNLRVVDASAFPSLLPGHPQSVVYMIAERAAELIKQENS